MTDTTKFFFATAVAALVISGCDLPTKSPDFSFTANVDAPLLFDKTFVFLGPDASGLDALVDTTRTSFDSLFTVSARSEEIFIVQEIDDFDVGDLDNAIDPVTIDPVDVGVTIGSLATPDFSGSVDQRVGIYESPALSAPGVPPSIESGAAFYPVAVGDLLVQPDNDIVDLSGASITDYHFTSDGESLNQLTFTLSNNLAEDLTDGSFVSGSVPRLIVERGNGTEVTSVDFNRAPQPGQDATATLDLSSTSIPADGRFRLDAGTPSGFQPISDNPQNIPIASDLTPLRYDGVTLSSLPPQSDVGNTNSDFTATGDIDFTGVVTQSGSVDIVVANDLPIDLTVDDIRLSNIDAVDTYAAGHNFAITSGQVVPANSQISIPVSLGVTGISRDIRATVILSSPGSVGEVDIYSVDGVAFSVNASATIEKVYFRPGGEEFSDAGSVAVDVDQIQFVDPTDFVEIGSGSLNISSLVNDLDLAMDEVQLSFPELLLPPYSPADTLTIMFEGSADDPSNYRFRAIGRNEPPRNVGIDLAAMRMFVSGGSINYNVLATAEQSTDVREVSAGDEIRSTVDATGIEVTAIQASIDPISLDVTEDADLNGALDVLAPSESIETTLTGIDDLRAFGFSSLSLSGTELTLDITTNADADFVLYAAIAGVDPDGNVFYLGGRGASAIQPSDTMAARFEAGGAPIDASNLLRMEVSPAGGQSTTTAIVLNEDNSSVDDFINGLPSTMRLAASVIIEPDGGQVSLQLPVEFDIGVGASIPLRFRGDAVFNKEVSADLSGLDDLTDEERTLALDEAILRLGYDNGIPLGLQARIHVLDATGSVVTVIPPATEPAMTIGSAETGGFGTATEPASGIAEIAIDNAALSAMAAGSDLQLSITLVAGQEGVRRVRATDEIRFNLTGQFDLKVSTGN